MAVDPLSDPLVQEALRRAGRAPETLDLTPAEKKANFDPDLLPDVGPVADRSQEDMDIDAVLDRLDILDAYQRWCGKQIKERGAGKGHVFISCPSPTHPDNDPSASVNMEEQVWYCHGCEIGGDKYDIAAWHFGYDVPGYKGKDFPQLRRDMAMDLGYVITRIGDQDYLSDAEPVEDPNEQIQGMLGVIDNPPVEVQSPLAEVVSISGEDLPDIEDPYNLSSLRIDWETLLQKDSFLYAWMRATTIDDIPQEFYFWLGLQAVGLAAGNDVWLSDIQPVKPNLYIVLYGNTASGKTRATYPYMEMVHIALPWDGDDYTPSTGVQILPTPASAEALLEMFSHPIKDPSTQQVVEYAPVRGLLKVDEFSSFVARASRGGNPMKEQLMDLYDWARGRPMTMKSRTGGLLTAESPFAQVVTTTQPRAIHAYLNKTDAESGFMNRWVFAAGKSRTTRISYNPQKADITVPADMLRSLRAWCSTGRDFVLSGPALVVWDNFFHDEIVPLQEEDEAMLSRIDLTLKKLIVLFTVNAKEPQPTPQTVGQAISLFPYLKHTATMFSKDINHSDFQACKQKIIKAIAGKNSVSKSAIVRTVEEHFDSQLIANVIKNMIDLEQLSPAPEKTSKGRTVLRYKYVG